MRAIFAFFILLFGATASFAEESKADYQKRLQKHVDAVRYDSIVSQAAARGPTSELTAVISFRVDADGKIANVQLVEGNVSSELGKYIVRAFATLPPVKNVPKSMGAGKVMVELQLGGKPGKK